MAGIIASFVFVISVLICIISIHEFSKKEQRTRQEHIKGIDIDALLKKRIEQQSNTISNSSSVEIHAQPYPPSYLPLPQYLDVFPYERTAIEAIYFYNSIKAHPKGRTYSDDTCLRLFPFLFLYPQCKAGLLTSNPIEHVRDQVEQSFVTARSAGLSLDYCIMETLIAMYIIADREAYNSSSTINADSAFIYQAIRKNKNDIIFAIDSFKNLEGARLKLYESEMGVSESIAFNLFDLSRLSKLQSKGLEDAPHIADVAVNALLSSSVLCEYFSDLQNYDVCYDEP